MTMQDKLLAAIAANEQRIKDTLHTNKLSGIKYGNLTFAIVAKLTARSFKHVKTMCFAVEFTHETQRIYNLQYIVSNALHEAYINTKRNCHSEQYYKNIKDFVIDYLTNNVINFDSYVRDACIKL